MPIKIACPCGKRLRARDDQAGKRVKCPECGRSLPVAGEATSPAAEAPATVPYGFWLAGGSVALTLLVIVGAVLLLRGGTGEPEEPSEPQVAKRPAPSLAGKTRGAADRERHGGPPEAHGDHGTAPRMELLPPPREEVEPPRPPTVAIVSADPDQPRAGGILSVRLQGTLPESGSLSYQFRIDPKGEWRPAPEGRVSLRDLKKGLLTLEVRAVDNLERSSATVVRSWTVQPAPRPAGEPVVTQPKAEVTQPKITKPTAALTGHTDLVMRVAFAPDGARALTASKDRTVRLWDIPSGKQLQCLEGHRNHVYGVAFSPDGTHALSGANDRTVRLWDLEKGKSLRVLYGHTAAVHSVAFSSDGRRAFSAGSDNTLRTWDLETGKELRCISGMKHLVLRVVFSADGRRALSGHTDKVVRLWNLETGQEERRLEGHSIAWVYGVAFSPDGTRALSSGHDEVILWDLATGEAIRRFTGHTSIVHSVVWSGDGRRALSGGHDQTVRLWDVDTGKELHRIEGPARLWSAALSPDGRWVLTGSWDAEVRLYGLAR